MAGGRGRTYVLMGAEKQALIENILREIDPTNEALMTAVIMLLANGHTETQFASASPHITELRQRILDQTGDKPTDVRAQLSSDPISKQIQEIKSEFHEHKLLIQRLNETLEEKDINVTESYKEQIEELKMSIDTLDEQLAALKKKSPDAKLGLMSDKIAILEEHVEKVLPAFKVFIEKFNENSQSLNNLRTEYKALSENINNVIQKSMESVQEIYDKKLEMSDKDLQQFKEQWEEFRKDPTSVIVKTSTPSEEIAGGFSKVTTSLNELAEKQQEQEQAIDQIISFQENILNTLKELH